MSAGHSTAGTLSRRAPLLDEHEVRAAAGLTMAIGAVAFAYAYFDRRYGPLQAVTAFFCLEFLLRVTVGLRASPVGVVARAITRGRPAAWVTAGPKRFAWGLGLCVGCKLAGALARRGRIRVDDACAQGACEPEARR